MFEGFLGRATHVKAIQTFEIRAPRPRGQYRSLPSKASVAFGGGRGVPSRPDGTYRSQSRSVRTDDSHDTTARTDSHQHQRGRSRLPRAPRRETRQSTRRWTTSPDGSRWSSRRTGTRRSVSPTTACRSPVKGGKWPGSAPTAFYSKRAPVLRSAGSSRTPFFLICVCIILAWAVSLPLFSDVKAWMGLIHTVSSVPG
jgi:hypothetical protein